VTRARWIALAAVLPLLGIGCGKVLGFEDDKLVQGGGGAATVGATGPDGSGADSGEPSDSAGTTFGAGASQGGRAGSSSAEGGAAGRARGGSADSGSGGAAVAGESSTTGGTAGSGGAGAKPCAGRAGPDMVRVGAYCIDRTEVTRRQYREFFLQHTDPSLVESCEWKMSFTDVGVDASEFDFPVGYVDWCDAKGYCEWAGKRLCGKIGTGGALIDDEIYTADARSDEWYRACSSGGTRTYVYGQSYDATACNITTEEMSAMGEKSPASKVGSYPECRTAAGVLDLLGNVWEWENACNDGAGIAPADAKCAHRGGSSYFLQETCIGRMSQARSFTAPDLGFRCCSD